MPEERERLRPLAAAFSEEDLLRVFEVLTKVETDLRWAQDPRVTLELALLKLVADAAADALRRAGGARRAAGRRRAGARRAGPPPAAAPRAAGGRAAAHRVRPPRAAPPAGAAPAARRRRRRARAAARAAAPRRAADGPDGLLAAHVALAAGAAVAGPAAARRAGARGRRHAGARGRAPTSRPFAAMHADEYRELARKAAGPRR